MTTTMTIKDDEGKNQMTAKTRHNATVTLAPIEGGGGHVTKDFTASSLPAAHDIVNWRLDREWSGFMALALVFVEDVR
jgi:hypothetical protein